MSLITLQKLLSLPREQTTVEFKSNLNEPKDIGEYLSALANVAALDGHDRGWVVWGVEDGTQKVKGTVFDPFKQKIGNQSLIMWLQHLTSPRADFTFHECQHPNGKVVLLEIHPARGAPVAFEGQRFIRVDSHKVKLSDHQGKEARLWAMLGPKEDPKEDWTGVLVEGATLEDLDPAAIVAARHNFTEYLLKSESDTSRHADIRTEAAALDVPTLLNKARVTKQGRITRAALLLLGKDEAAHFLAPIDAKMSWLMRDADNATGTGQHFPVPFLLASDKLLTRIRNEQEESLPDGTLFPTPVPWYDPWVIREALHNCVAHQDYVLGGKINVVEHPDRLVFSNLGQFLAPSVEWMLAHQSPPEHYRNQWLIDSMIRLRMIDQQGGGIRRMFDKQRLRFYPMPDFVTDKMVQGLPRVEVTITRQVLDAKYTKMLMKRTDLTLNQVVLLDRVQKHRSLLPEQVRELKALKLLEGRAPNYLISSKVAEWTGQKARYLRERGMNDKYYQDLVVQYLQKYGQATRLELDDLLLTKLPEVLDATQKINKIRNLQQAMRRSGLIERTGPRGAPIWKLLASNSIAKQS